MPRTKNIGRDSNIERVWPLYEGLCWLLSSQACLAYPARALSKAVMCLGEVHSGCHWKSSGDRHIIKSDEAVRTEKEQEKSKENRWWNPWGLVTAHGHKGTVWMALQLG